MTDKLPFTPEAESYGVDHPHQTVAVMLAGGKPRVRADVDSHVSIVSANWKLDYADYMTFMHFMEVTVAHGSLPFLVDLATNFFAPVQHKCTMVPRTFKTHNVRGISYQIQMQLAVEQNRSFFAPHKFDDPNEVFFGGVPAPLNFSELFQIGDKCQIVGAGLNNGVNPPINLDGIYTISNIPTTSRLTFSNPQLINPDWLKLASYPAGITDLIPNMVLINVPV